MTDDCQSADPAALRRTLGAFMTGVTVVTARDGDGRPRGLTANSFTSVSLEPPLVLICIGTAAASCAVFQTAASFAINILAEDQVETSSLFASKRPDKFEMVDWTQIRNGTPVLDANLAWLDCDVHERQLLGDHLVLVGRVVDFGRGAGRPLGFFGGAYVQLPPVAGKSAR